MNKLALEDEDEVEELAAEVSIKGLKYDELFVREAPEARKKEAEYRAKKAEKSILSFFSFKAGLGWFFRKKKKEEYYEFVGLCVTAGHG